MAATSVILDIRANTSRALNEFKRFSSQLDNKFLISGLKLDVVRSALGQINREFQKAIGEQGLATGQSMRQAENQAAAILGTFKGVGLESSIAITEQFSQAFNRIAVEAGGTAKDVQKALSATPFISTNLSEDLRNQLAEGIQKFQIQATRGGFGDDYSRIIQRYLAGQVTARQLVETGDPLQSKIGAALSRASGTDGATLNAEARSKAVLRIQEQGGNIERLLTTAEERADWGISVIQKLNASLFNPREGLFGSLREITMSIGDKTTIFRETRALIESVFGRQGFFVGFFAQITKIFGIEDPLKVVIKGIRWLTTQFERLTRFLESEQVRSIVDIAQKAVSGVVSFFQGLYARVEEEFKNPDSLVNRIGNRISGFFKAVSDAVRAGDWDPDKIQESIKAVGKDVRTFIGNLGKSFRESDLSKQSNFIISILGTLVEEVARTIGAVISEGIKSLFSDKGIGVIAGLIGVVNKGLTGFFSEIFGNQTGGVLGAVVTGGIVAAFGKKLAVGLVAFGARMLRALPGANFFGRIIGRGLTVLGQRIARQLRAVPGLHRLLPSGGGTRGAPATALGFEREMLLHVRRIANCVCLPGFRGGRSGGPGGGGGLDPGAQARRDRVRSGRGPTGPGRIPGPDRGAILPGTQYRRAIGPQPDVSSSYLGVREARKNVILRRPTSRGSANLDRALDLYATSLEGPFSDLDFDQRREKGARISRADATSIRNSRARYQRRYGAGGRMASGLRGIGRLGSRLGGGRAALAGTAITALLAGGATLLGSGKTRAGEMSPEFQEQLDQVRAEQQTERDELLSMGGSAEEAEALQSQQSAEILQLRSQLEKDEKQEKREGTRGWLGLGSSLAGGWAGGKAGAALGAGVGSLFGGVGAGPGAIIGGILGGVIGSIAGDEAVKLISDPVLDSMGNLGKTIGGFFTETIPGAWNSAISSIGSWIDNVKTTISNFFTETVPNAWNSAISSIGSWIDNVKTTISNFFTETVPNAWNSAISSIGSWIDNVKTTISNFFTETVPNAWNSAISSIGSWIDNVKTTISNFFTETVPNAWNSAISSIGSWIDSVKTTIGNFFTETLPNAWSSGVSFITSTIPNKLKSFAEEIGKALISSVSNFNLGNALLSSLNYFRELFSKRTEVAGSREVGGPVLARRSYIVGERGKELFTPGTNGSITSNSHLMAALNKPSQEPASISANFTVAINVTGGLGTDNVEALRAPILAIVEQAWQEASSGTIKI
jgi:hypothetical protein